MAKSSAHSEVSSLLTHFPAASKLNGNNWATYSTELEVTFFMVEDVWAHISGECSPRPTPSSAAASSDADLKSWDDLDALALLILWRTVADLTVRDTHIKKGKTASSIWSSFKAAFEKDTRSHRFELKRRLYNPVHNPMHPISKYIQDIVSASESLTALGHAPPPVDVVDSIIMHLDVTHPEWKLVRNLLTTRSSDPTLDELRSLLMEHECVGKLDKRVESDAAGESSALHALGKGKGKGKSKKSCHRSPGPARSGSASDHGGHSSSGTDGQSHSWLSPRDPKRDCHRCGRRGHLARYCMFDMPDHVKDMIGKANRFAKKTYRASLASLASALDDPGDNPTSSESSDEFAGSVQVGGLH